MEAKHVILIAALTVLTMSALVGMGVVTVKVSKKNIKKEKVIAKEKDTSHITINGDKVFKTKVPGGHIYSTKLWGFYVPDGK